MITQYDIHDGYVKALILRLNPVEGLVLHSALIQYADDLENNEKDRMTAINMCDSYMRAMNFGGGSDDTN